jgi:hypothetical protein
MMVPESMQHEGLRACDDIIKIFITSQPSLFDLLELPKLGEAIGERSSSRVDEQLAGLVSEQLEDWASVSFHIRVSL